MRKFGFAAHIRQACAIAVAAFGVSVKSPAGFIAAIIATLVVVLMPVVVGLKGVSILPGTSLVLNVLTAPVADNSRLPWVLIPLLIVFCTGELVWRERDARVSEIADATPVPEWVLFLGKFLGLSLVLAAWMVLVALACVLGQVRMGYFHPETGLYLRILFGLQLIDYLLFALLMFVVHVVVNQKQLGYLMALIAYGVIAFPSTFGLEDHLLIYGSGPKWTYSDMRGFGSSLVPWMWFRLYWAAWAVLLSVAGTLLWPRGTERSLRSRVRTARHRFTGGLRGVTVTAVALIVTAGGFVLYNTHPYQTNWLNPYRSEAGETERQAEYERRYGKYGIIAQPAITSTNLRVEVYPDRQNAEIRGTYVVTNTTSVAIDSIHLTTVPELSTSNISMDRPASRVLMDNDLGYHIYALERPLQAGDSLHLNFAVQVAPQGFRNNGAGLIVGNGSHFTNRDWLPAIGYQRDREIRVAGVRRQYGLPRRPAVASLDDERSRRIRVGGDPISFEAIMGTSIDQTAVAPGVLRDTWKEGGRRYFHYVTDVPVNNHYGVFSARYAVHEDQWRPAAASGRTVAIQIFHHPAHNANLGRMLATVRASLDFYTRQFGPYPYSYIRLIENPGPGMGVHTEAATIEYSEGFSLLNPGTFGPGKAGQDRDVVFAVVAHAVARGWWGMQVVPADVAGAGLLDVSLETYSAMRVIEEVLGPEQLHRYLQFLGEELIVPRKRAIPPLLRATDSFSFARKGPMALYAMREAIGRDRVDDALRSLLRKHGTGVPPHPTSLDLYRELQAVTPDSWQYLLRDLFETNTFWELATERASAKQISAEAWQVTLEVRARKVVVDEAGSEIEVPMDDWVQVGVFGEGKPFMEMRRIRSGQQTITVTVQHKPTSAGIDPQNLLIDLDTENNIREVK